MNRLGFASPAPLAALLLASSALAQTIPSSNASDVDAGRFERRCTSATLSTDASAPCSDDVRNDGPRVSPIVIHQSINAMVGSGNTVAESPGTSMGTGMPSTGLPNSGTSSMQDAAGAGTTSASGASRGPARR